jgi:hypothetical protein
MSRAAIEVRINVARREMEYWQNLLAKRSCKDCEHFQQGGCKLANGVQPPAEVQKVGCDSWEWDSIPF